MSAGSWWAVGRRGGLVPPYVRERVFTEAQVHSVTTRS